MESEVGLGGGPSRSLGEQFTALPRERDEANANAEILKQEVARLRAANAKKSEMMLKSSKEWQERMDMLRCYLATTTMQLSSKAQELESLMSHQAQDHHSGPTTRQVDEALEEIAMIQAVAAPTADVVAALTKFLSQNAAITGDSFLGAGKDFDHMRFLIDQIPKPPAAEPSVRTSGKNG